MVALPCHTMSYFAGIDVGSLSTNAVILDEALGVLGHSIIDTGANSTEAADRAMELVCEAAKLRREAIVRVVATGYGRISVPFAARQVTEISCHGLGAWHLFPGVETVIDIGGQDSKVIRLGPEGRVVDFAMNDKCAAGTGRFLEVMARKLEAPLSALGEIAATADKAAKISSVCTVFAESEVVSLVAKNHPKQEIVAGLHQSIVARVWALASTVGIEGEVAFSGGVAKNTGVVAELERRLGRKLHIHSEPQIVGALGAALIAARQARAGIAG